MKKKIKIALYTLILSGLTAFILYQAQNNRDCTFIGLRRLSGTNFYFLDSKVGNHSCLLELDLGGNYEFWLSKKMIQSAPFKKVGSAKYTYEENREIEEPLYQIPEMTIGNLKIKHAIARQDEHDFSPELPASETNISYRIGKMGSKILDHTNLLLDIPRRCLYFTKSTRPLKAKGYDLGHWLVVPFEKAKSGVKIEVETDLGYKSFILFTASTHVILKPSVMDQEMVNSQKFVINGVNFGPVELVSYDIPNACPADGLIGLSFLQNRAVYIDYSHRRLYIQQ